MPSPLGFLLPCLVASALTVWAGDNTATAKIGSLNARIQRAPDAPGMEAALRERYSLLRELIPSEPQRALSLSFSRELLARLANTHPASLETRGQWEGRGFPIVEDFRDGSSRHHLRIHTANGDLHVYPSGAATLSAGTRTYRVEGIRVGNLVAAESITALDPAAADTCTTTGNQRTIALLVSLPGALGPTFTQADVQNWLFGPDPSLNGFLQDASYGQTSASGMISNWFTLNQSFTYDQLAEVQQIVFTQAATQGIDLTQYSRIVFFAPSIQGLGIELGQSSVGCYDSTQGTANVHASVAWIFGESSASAEELTNAVFHEVGHSLGLDHSTSLACGVVSLTPDSSSCQSFEYGDPYSVMGGATFGHYTAPQKYALGWITDANVMTVPSSGSAMLQPVSSQTPGIRALRTPRTVGGTDWLWMEVREPVGPYESTNLSASSGHPTGAVVHFQPQSAGGSIANLTRTQMIGIPPVPLGSGGPFNAVGAGGRWTDPFSGLSMSVAQGSGSELNVSVNRDNACFTLGTSASMVSGSGGTGTVAVSAPSGCSWNASRTASWLTIQGNASGTGNGTVTYLAAANQGMPRQALLTIGGRGVLVSQPEQNVPASVLPLSPASITGSAAFLTFLLTDQTPFNYSTVSFNITTGSPSQPVCNFTWDEPNHQFRLINDDGVTFTTASDQSYTIDLENSTCAVLIALPEFYGDDSQFALPAEVVWKKPGGTQTIYLRAVDIPGNDTGWQKVGSWSIAADRPPSQPVLPGAPGAGLQHLFVIETSDPDGPADIRSVELDIGTGSHRCSLIYLRTIQEGVEFLNDDGTRSGWVIGIPASASNSYCSLDLLRSSSSVSGNNETVLLPVTFLSALAGQQPVQVIVTDWFGQTATLNTTWNVATSNAQPAISSGGIVNGANWQPGGVVSGEIVTIFGSNLGPAALQQATVVDNELPRTIAGTTVYFDSTPVPLLYVSQSAVSVIVTGGATPTSHVEIATNGGISSPVDVPVVNAAPGIFTYSNSQQAVAFNQDYSFNIDMPAARGTYISLYVTGLTGFFDPYGNLDFGAIPPSNPYLVSNWVQVQFGNDPPIQASFAGLTFTGVAQVNALIDSNAPTGDAVPVRVIATPPSQPSIISPAATLRIK